MKKIKLIIFNEDRKMLIFSKTRDLEKYFLPTLYIEKDSINIPEVMHVLGISTDDTEILNAYKDVNEEVEEKRYVTVYHEFSNREYDTIYQLCTNHGIIPYMITMNELRYINYLRKKGEVIIDFGILPSAKTLQKKLNYEKY